MLQRTFCHLSGISASRERQLWQAGIVDWTGLAAGDGGKPLLAEQLEESHRRLAAGDAGYFSDRLPAREHWRLLPEFPDSTAYLDIETTGLSRGRDSITSIALYNGRQVQTFVQGENLDSFPAAIAPYRLLVSYNGKSFDIPFIEQAFGIRLDQAHVDLRYPLHSLGLRGGLKGCERQLGIARQELAGIDGYFAVLLWREYCRSGDPLARQTLLAYNVADTVNLAALAVHAYNRKLAETPFAAGACLPLPAAPALPYRVETEQVLNLRRRLCGW